MGPGCPPRPSVTTWPPVQATAPQEERHDVTTLYHRMSLEDLQNKFGLKVSPRLGRLSLRNTRPRTPTRDALTLGQQVPTGLSRATGPPIYEGAAAMNPLF